MIGPGCVLTAMPVNENADELVREAARRMLRCSTCGGIVSVPDLVALEPGQCPVVADAARG